MSFLLQDGKFDVTYYHPKQDDIEIKHLRGFLDEFLEEYCKYVVDVVLAGNFVYTQQQELFGF